jgi:Holin of 3TMs, for gene-transfer release
MALDITGLGQAATAAKGILGMIFPDKTEEEKSKLAAAMALIQGQTSVDNTEAASTDPLQHWRGGLGWVCTLAYLNNFILVPWATALGMHVPAIDFAPLATLTAGMLGLGGMHMYQTVQAGK